MSSSYLLLRYQLNQPYRSNGSYNQIGAKRNKHVFLFKDKTINGVTKLKFQFVKYQQRYVLPTGHKPKWQDSKWITK